MTEPTDDLFPHVEPSAGAAATVPGFQTRLGRVAPHEDGQRLDRWCRQHWPDVPHGLLQKSARKGQLRLSGTRAAPDSRVEAGQEVLLRGLMNGEGKPFLRKDGLMDTRSEERMRRMVLKAEPRYFVLNKPAGLAVQGGSGQASHVDGMLSTLQGNAPERPKLVHRIDRDTSGVLLIARDTAAATGLTRMFADKVIRKVYWALVLGVPKKSRGKIELALVKGSETGEKEKMQVAEHGQAAETHYRIIETADHYGLPYAWLELMPITGRTHQLRVHLAAIGHPMLGDVKYGGRGTLRPDLPQQLHLHARRLVIDREDAGALGAIDVQAPLPEHFRDALRAMRLPAEDTGVSLLEHGL